MKSFTSRIVVALAATLSLTLAAHAEIVGPPSVTGHANEFSGSFVAENTVDGTTADYASAGLGTATFIEYDFGTVVEFDRVIMVNRNSPDGGDRVAQATLTYDSGSDTITTNSGRSQSGIYGVGSTSTQTVRWDVDIQGAGAAPNTGLQEIIFLNTPDKSNVSTGVVAYAASSEFNGTYLKGNAVNGIVGNATGGAGIEYASASQGANTTIDFDLGAVTPITGFDLIDRFGGVDQYTAYDIIFSNSSTFATTVATKNYTKAGLTDSDSFVDTPVNARYVRIDVVTAGSSPNSGVSEFILYERNVITPTVVSVEEEFATPRYEIENLFDEQLDGNGADWASVGDDATSFVVDFEGIVLIDGINYANRRDSGNSAADYADTIKLVFSDDLTFDGSDAMVTISPDATIDLTAYLFDTEIARYVQVTVTGKTDIAGNVGGAQLHFFAQVPTPAALPAGMLLLGALAARRKR